MSFQQESASRAASVLEPESGVQTPRSDVSLEAAEKVVEFQRPFGTLRWIAVCAALYISALLYGLDTTVAADVQGAVLASLGNIEKLAWVGIGFPLGSVATILLIGTAFGTFDVKYIYIGGLILFEIGSAICGAAPNMNTMIIGRVIAGIGGAGVYLGALNYFSIFTSMRERALYISSIGVAWGIGCILGPVIGGGFAVSSATWRWAFYINLPIAAVCAPIYLFLLPNFNPQPTVSTKEKLAKLDWFGAVLNAATYSLFMVVLNFSGSTWAWNSAGVITLWVVFGVVLIGYGLQAAFSIFTTPEHRLFPVQFIFRRTMLLLYFTTATATTALFVTIYYIPLFFQFVRDDSPIQAAVRLLPFIALNIAFGLLAGALLPVFGGRYVLFYVPAGILMVVGGSLMYTVDANTSAAAIYGYEILIAVGAGLIQQMGYSIAAAKVKPEEVPAAIGWVNVAQIGSIAIALSISGAIFQNLGFAYLSAALADYNFTDEEIRSALAGAQSAILSQGDEMVRSLAINAVVTTISKSYILVITAGALTLVSAAAMRFEKLKLSPVAGA